MSDPARTAGAGLRAAVVGLGDISGLHLDAIAADPAAELVAVCDLDRERADAGAQKWAVPAYTALEDLLNAHRPDVVHLCVPHHLHASMAIECLRQDVNVLLEKPLATSVADGRAVVAAERASAAQLGVCFQNRYNAASLAIRSVIDDGSLGRLLGGRAAVTWFRDANYYRRRPWRATWSAAGGGVLINQAIHTLDLLQWFLGPPTQVRGHAERLWLPDTIEVEDTATIGLTHPGGATSLFYATNGYVTNAPVQLELVAENGSLRLDTDLTVHHADGRQVVVPETVLGTGEKAYWGAAHAVLIADFYRRVQAGERFSIDASAALHSLEILTAVYANSPQLRTAN